MKSEELAASGSHRKLRTIEMNRISVEEFREAEKLPLIVVLDDVRSMYNIGSVFRTCDAFRVEAIYLCGITACPPHQEIHKTALGAEDSVAWRYFETAEQAVEQLHQDGYFVWSVEQCEGSTKLQDLSTRPQSLPKGGKSDVISGSASNFIIREKQTHQAHVMIGNRAYDIHHPLRIPLYLLNNILGGPGMNARLNISLRERNGLVYTVDSSMVSYSDTGLWAIYFGCDPHDVKRCLRLVRHELDKIIEKPLTDSQLKAAKRQLKGQIGIACDNREQFALDFGKSFLHYGWEKDITSLYSQIDEVTAAQIQQVAQELMAEDRLTTLIYR